MKGRETTAGPDDGADGGTDGVADTGAGTPDGAEGGGMGGGANAGLFSMMSVPRPAMAERASFVAASVTAFCMFVAVGHDESPTSISDALTCSTFSASVASSGGGG